MNENRIEVQKLLSNPKRKIWPRKSNFRIESEKRRAIEYLQWLALEYKKKEECGSDNTNTPEQV